MSAPPVPVVIYTDPILLLADYVERSGHSMRSLSLAAGLGHSTLQRWLARTREPNVADLNKVLALMGLQLAVVPKV